MTVDMDTRRVADVASVLRTEVGDLQRAFPLLTDAERLSQDVAMMTGVRTPLTEFLNETARLAEIVETYHDLTVDADRLHPTDLARRRELLAGLLGRLAAGLGDGVGAAGTAAEMRAFGNAMRAAAETSAETVLDWMQSSGRDGFSLDEFAALATDAGVPAHVREAIATLTADPVLTANLDRAAWLTGTSGSVSTAALALFVATQQASRGLGDRGTFEAFDRAKTGDADDRISWDDVHLLADDRSADPAVRALAELLEANPAIFEMLDTGTRASGAERMDPYWAFDFDGRISFGDVVATAVNTQAFEGRAGEARDFVMGLPSTNDYRDATGNILSIRWFSDSGVRSLASSALAATPTLSEQVGVVGRLPESPGGVRNLAITEYYRRIGHDIDLILNPDGGGGALPLDAQGSTGANWFMPGAFASSEVRPVLVDDNGFGPVTAGWAARQSMADGNQLLFDALAPAAAAFVEAFPQGTEPSRRDVELFFDESWRADGQRLFVNGDRQLRDGFALLLDAMTDPDPVTRQRTTFQSTLLIGVHEQALVDPFVDRAIDQGWDDGFRVLGDLFDSDESIATGQIDPDLGDYRFDADRPLPVRGGHPDHVRGQDLTTTLNPTNVDAVSIGGLTYDLSGGGARDVDLVDLQGWDDPPDDWDLDAQVIDPADWHDEHGSFRESTPGQRRRSPEIPDSSTGVPLPGNDGLPGAAVDDWKDYGDRMWTITNGFHQTHTLPSVADTLPGNGFDEADLSFLPEPS